MLIKRYIIRNMNPAMVQHLRDLDEKTYWIIAAGDMASAWRKFTRQYFGPELPDPADYDISFHSLTPSA